RRTDIWSLGCILYETLTGQRPFRGTTLPDTLAAVLGKDPDWSALPADTPATIRALLRRCLQRDRERRMHDMADVRIELDEAIASPVISSDGGSPAPSATSVRALELALAAILLCAIAAGIKLARWAAPLEIEYAGLNMQFSLPTRIYLTSANWAPWVFGVIV